MPSLAIARDDTRGLILLESVAVSHLFAITHSAELVIVPLYLLGFVISWMLRHNLAVVVDEGRALIGPRWRQAAPERVVVAPGRVCWERH